MYEVVHIQLYMLVNYIYIYNIYICKYIYINIYINIYIYIYYIYIYNILKPGLVVYRKCAWDMVHIFYDFTLSKSNVKLGWFQTSH